jgi:hypothetical protein
MFMLLQVLYIGRTINKTFPSLSLEEKQHKALKRVIRMFISCYEVHVEVNFLVHAKMTMWMQYYLIEHSD